MTNPTEPSSELVPKAVDTNNVDTPNLRTERLWALHEEHGLTAHSPGEINYMHHLLEPQYARGGAKEYVRRIASSRAKHAYQKPIDAYEEMVRGIFHSGTLAYQIKAKFVDPEGEAAARESGNRAAIASVEKTTMFMTDTFLGYLDDAKQTVNALTRFEKSLSVDDSDQLEKLTPIAVEEGMMHDPNTKRAIGAITRYIEAFLFSNNAGDDYTKTDYMSEDADIVSREIETVTEVDIAFLRQIVGMVRDMEQARERFWVEQLFGHRADQESGIGARTGLTSINIEGLKEYIETAMLQIYRGTYRPHDESAETE